MGDVMVHTRARVGPSDHGIKTIEPDSDLTTLPTSHTADEINTAGGAVHIDTPMPSFGEGSGHIEGGADEEFQEFHRVLAAPDGDGRSSPADDLGEAGEQGNGQDEDGGSSGEDTDLDHSMSLTEFDTPKGHAARKRSGHPSDHLHHYANTSSVNNATMSPSSSALDTHEEEVGNISAQGEGPLPTPPRHFLCPIQNTLLVDPVIDREGNTYERDAILRWLVLTSTTFSCGMGESVESAESGDTDTSFDGDAKFDAGDKAALEGSTTTLSGTFLRGTSPVTGHPLTVEELVEDKVVKAAIERWRKEAWVRFLLGNKEGAGGEIDVQALVGGGESVGQKKPATRGGSKTGSIKGSGIGGSNIHEIIQRESGLHDMERLKSSMKGVSKASKSPRQQGSLHDLHKLGGSKQKKKYGATGSSHASNRSSTSRKSGKSHASAKSHTSAEGHDAISGSSKHKEGDVVPTVVSPSASPAKSPSGKHTPPPPPPKASRTPTPRRSKRETTGSSSKSGSKGRSKGLTSSQKTAVASNATPATSATPNATAATSNLSPTSSATSKPPPPDYLQEQAPPEESPVARKHTLTSVPQSIPAIPSSGSSFCSNLSNYDLYSMPLGPAATTQPRQQFNGWSVPLGVHKVICRSPGLRVTTQIHRRSVPVKINAAAGGDGAGGEGTADGVPKKKELIVPPGSYVEILETQVHGERVRGRICWEEEEEDTSADSKKKKKKGLKKRTSRLLKRTSRKKGKKEIPMITVEYEGWISLQWAKSEEERDGGKAIEEEGGSVDGRATDEDAGPWTEPVPLGVYRINFGGGLPLRETPERDSPLLSKLDRGRCVEVVQTQVKGDRVRARVIVPNMPGDDADGTGGGKGGNGTKFTSGWISLLNALTGSSGASPVPLGAYVVVAEPGCVITEGGRLDSKVKGTLVPGSCIEVVATRMEEGVVRGLIDGGGHVTLFVPPGVHRGGAASPTSGKKNSDGGRMFAMPVPLGTYQIIHAALPVTSGISPTSPIVMKLQLNATAEVVETRVEEGRVRGRICAVVNEDGSRVVGYERASNSSTSESNSTGDACGWINLFEPERRWARIVCFRGGKPVNQQSLRRRSSKNAA